MRGLRPAGPGRLTRYLGAAFLARWVGTALAVTVLIGLLDGLANAPEVAERAAAAGRGGQGAYLAARAPVIFDRIGLLTVLLALVLTYIGLVRRREVVALAAAGLSPARQLLALLPAVLLAALASGLIADRLVPPAVRSLQAWSAPGYGAGRLSEESPLWLRDGDRIVRVAGRLGPETVGAVRLFRLGEGGRLIAVTAAERAEWRGEGWALGGTRALLGAAPAASWRTAVGPDALDRLIAEPRDLSLADMGRLAALRGAGSRPSYAYEAWGWHRLTRPLAAIGLTLCVVPLMQVVARGAGGEKAAVAALAVGFGYFVLDGAMVALAERGAAPPAATVFVTVSVPFLLGAWLMLAKETVRP